jgi:cytidylate kinase
LESVVKIVAIDGPAGAGKSTVARMLAAELVVPYLDTGAMYRAVAFAVLRGGVDPEDSAAVAGLVADCEFEVGDRITVDGVDATVEIRGPEVTKAVSSVAANPAVRRELVARQRQWAIERGGGVLEGRDIGTEVFPDAVLKAYLTARPEVRAQRRFNESPGQSLEEISVDIERRDRLDSSRPDSPLREASDAVVVDTSDVSIDAVVTRLLAMVRDGK